MIGTILRGFAASVAAAGRHRAPPVAGSIEFHVFDRPAPCHSGSTNAFKPLGAASPITVSTEDRSRSPWLRIHHPQQAALATFHQDFNSRFFVSARSVKRRQEGVRCGLRSDQSHRRNSSNSVGSPQQVQAAHALLAAARFNDVERGLWYRSWPWRRRTAHFGSRPPRHWSPAGKRDQPRCDERIYGPAG